MSSESIGDAFSKTVHHLGAASSRARSRMTSASRIRDVSRSLTFSYSPDDTIVAIATPPGRGGIGVVRLSGPDAHRDRAAADRARPQPLEPRHATLARTIGRTPAPSISVVVTYFQAPHSYTGEDVVEISAHGSPVLLRAIVRGGDGRRQRGSPSQANSRCARI